MKFGGIQKLSLIDYPQTLSCVVFVIGCSFRCPWCHNSQLVIPEKSKTLTLISEKEILSFLKTRKNFLEGCVITGGEPTIYDQLVGFCQKVKKIGYKIKLDTNGSNPKILETLIEKKLIDYVAMDIKAPKEKYLSLIGLENLDSKLLKEKILNNIEKSIHILKKNKVDFEFRTTVVPQLLTEEDILKITDWIGPAKKYFLQNFQPQNTADPSFLSLKPYPYEFLIKIKKKISASFEVCEIR